MIIIYNPVATPADSVDPIVILDYTRSDEQYSPIQITQYIHAGANIAAKGKTVNDANLKSYSLDYEMTFTHSGINYGDSLKTKFSAVISNAPMELIGILNIKQYTSQENIDSLSTLTSKIIDPQAFFPTGCFVIKPNSNSLTVIMRPFLLYDTPFNFDSRRLNSRLELHGSEFDSMVIRLQFAVDIKIDKPLVSQISDIFQKQGFSITAPDLSSTMPKVARYYPPAPMNSVISEICRDNDIAFTLDQNQKTVSLFSLNQNNPPGSSVPIPPTLCFNNYVTGSNLIGTFALENYSVVNMTAEAFDVNLYDTVIVYDDTFNVGQFANLRKIPAPVVSGGATIFGYRFYILEYSYTDSSQYTGIRIKVRSFSTPR